MKNRIPKKNWFDSGVYTIESNKHGVLYVGATKCLIKRFRAHAVEMKGHSNELLKRHVEKHGHSHLEMKLHLLCPANILMDCESKAIDELNPSCNLTKTGISSLKIRENSKDWLGIKSRYMPDGTNRSVSGNINIAGALKFLGIENLKAA